MLVIKELEQYLLKVLGAQVNAEPAPKIVGLPLYLKEAYDLHTITLFAHHILLVETKDVEDISIGQTVRNFQVLTKNLGGWSAVLVMPAITALNRKRLIEKKINFIVPGKQMYLPDLLIDLKENFKAQRTKNKNEKLLPSAQFLILYHLLKPDADWVLEEHSFKDIAKKTRYTPMAVTKAVDNLKNLGFIEVVGEKEKFIRFKLHGKALWQEAENQNMLINPVRKKVFVDEKPANTLLLRSNGSALPEYSDMNETRQPYYALGKKIYFDLVEKAGLINENEQEGRYCLEIWKYNPLKLKKNPPDKLGVVDPLSLYLSLKGTRDERTEMALDQIIANMQW